MDSQTAPSFCVKTFLDRLVGLLNKTKARERMCRFFQYFAKFFTAFVKQKEGSSESAQEWAEIIGLIGTACAQTRKLLRFGMEFPCLMRINSLLEKYFQLQQKKRESRTR